MTTLAFLQSCLTFAVFVCVCAALLESRLPWPAARRRLLLVLAAVAAAEAVLMLAGYRPLALTFLPLTAYLPVIVCVHTLSARSFLQTCAVWSTGVLAAFLLEFLRKFWKIAFYPSRPRLCEQTGSAVLLLAAGVILWIVFRLLREPFRRCVRTAEDGWLPLLFPSLLAFLLLSYISNSTARPAFLLLVMTAALSVFFVLGRALLLAASLQETRAAEEAVRRQLELQRRDYAIIQRRMEMERLYRHDMRHHLAALDGMLRRSDDTGAKEYIQTLSGRLDELTHRTVCRNSTVNAALEAYLTRAERNGCRVELDVRLPAEVPYSEIDLCVVFANLLENAIQACAALPEEQRVIRLTAAFTDNGRLRIAAENPCPEAVRFDEEGFPRSSKGEGHGLGLRSVHAAAGRYGGLFRCGWEDGRFFVRVTLMSTQTPADQPRQVRTASRGKRAVAAASFTALCVALLACMPALAGALTPPVFRVETGKSWQAGWGDTRFTLRQPRVRKDGAEAVNRAAEEFTAQMEERFLWYVSRKYKGYVGADLRYSIVRNDDALLILRFDATINAGGSVDYSRHVTLDKASGEILELADLFLPDVRYAPLLSREIAAQMAEQNAAGEGNYFLPGGMWPEEDCFREIDPEQDFYIDAEGRLVIVFEEYSVAPGSMGAPEFTIPPELLAGVLARPLPPA